MKLHSSIQMKLINFDVFLRNRTNSRIRFPKFSQAQQYFVCVFYSWFSRNSTKSWGER